MVLSGLKTTNFYFIENYNEDSDEGHFLKADVQYFEKLQYFHSDLPALLEIDRIQKVKKLAATLHKKEEYAIHMRNVKQTLNHGLVLKKVHKVIKFNRKAWLKLYTDMNTELKKMQKLISKKIFSS